MLMVAMPNNLANLDQPVKYQIVIICNSLEFSFKANTISYIASKRGDTASYEVIG